MEIGAIGQNGDFRPLGARRCQQFPELAIDSRDVRHHFYQTYHGQAVRIHHGANAGFLHARAGAAEELQIGPATAERLHQTGRVEVPRRFTSRNQNFRAHYNLV